MQSVLTSRRHVDLGRVTTASCLV
ncbi:putative leader peptide [Streptomyces sp. NPDC127098]